MDSSSLSELSEFMGLRSALKTEKGKVSGEWIQKIMVNNKYQGSNWPKVIGDEKRGRDMS